MDMLSFRHWWWPPNDGDPGPDIVDLLDKVSLAQIRVRQIDQMVGQLTQQIELLKTTKGMLKEQYKIK